MRKREMKNRDMPAKPILSSKGFPSHDSVLDKRSCTGLTKLEYAAIEIFSKTAGDGIDVCWAIEKANELFDELDKQEQSE